MTPGQCPPRSSLQKNNMNAGPGLNGPGLNGPGLNGPGLNVAYAWSISGSLIFWNWFS